MSKWMTAVLLLWQISLPAQTLLIYGHGQDGRSQKVHRMLSAAGVEHVYRDVSEDASADRAMMAALEQAGLTGEVILLPVVASKTCYLNGALDHWKARLGDLKKDGPVFLYGPGDHDVSRELHHRMKAEGLDVRFRDVNQPAVEQMLFERHQAEGLSLEIRYPIVCFDGETYNDGVTVVQSILDGLLPPESRSWPGAPLNMDSWSQASAEKTAIEMLRDLDRAIPVWYDDLMHSPDEVTLAGWNLSLGPVDRLHNWLTGVSVGDVAADLNTAVHEVMHEYIGRMGWRRLAESGEAYKEDRRCFAFALPDGRTISVMKTPCPESHLMHDWIPKSHHGMRYATYIYPSEPEMSSRQYGIYGLLDEFCAYYWGTRAGISLYDYYRSLPLGDGSHWLNWINGVVSTLNAYTEFKLYMADYLQHTKKLYPSQYRKLRESPELIESLAALDQGFQQLVTRFHDRLNEIALGLAAWGIDAREQDGGFFIEDRGCSLFLEENRTLRQALEESPALNSEGQLGVL